MSAPGTTNRRDHDNKDTNEAARGKLRASKLVPLEKDVMLYPVRTLEPGSGDEPPVRPELVRRPDLLTRAARLVGRRALRADPCAFCVLLERTIEKNDRYFTPRSQPDALSIEELRLHGGRLEDLVDEAVELAHEIYPRKRRDVVLLAIAGHAERLMRRIWSDPFKSGARFFAELGRAHGPVERDPIRSLHLVKRSPDDTDP